MDVNGKDYEVIRLLGKGKSGYAYLVTDGEQEYVLKQIHHEPCDYYEFGDKLNDEIRAYEHLKKIGIPMPVLYDVDQKQERILKEYIEGELISDLVERHAMKQEYMVQIREMCSLLYPAHTNIDYYPTNFAVREGRLFYVDYECNEYMEEWDFEHWGVQYWQ